MTEIQIIGTSHIAQQSVKEVKEAIQEMKPDFVAIELDYGRFKALQSDKKERSFGLRDIKYIGIKGFIFALIGEYVEKKLGKIVKTKPGADMLAAIETAKKEKIPIALIDQNIAITLRRFSKALTWKEKWKMFVDVLKGLFFGKREMKKMGFEKIDFSKVPEEEIIKKAMKVAKKRYPSLYKVLVTERNHFMAKMLKAISQQNPDAKILAVMGAGHAEDVRKLVKGK